MSGSIKAFPSEAGPNLKGIAFDKELGMDLRDYFAAKVMQAAISNPRVKEGNTNADIARHSYLVADAMLKARAANHE